MQKRFARGAGILLPVFSLPGGVGIGNIGRTAYDFVDFLAAAGQKVWQVLPLGPTGYGDSPYAAHSAFAGNPYFLPLETEKAGKAVSLALQQLSEGDESRVDYTRLYRYHGVLLEDTLSRMTVKEEEFAAFRQKEAYWLPDYALYATIKKAEGGKPWPLWENDGLRHHADKALERFAQAHKEEIRQVELAQYLFDRAWGRLHEYAALHGVELIGDLPLYVALDSADVWARRELFLLDAEGRPQVEAGVPPDEFSVTGQLWGNPIYHWERMQQDGYTFWKKRMEKSAGMYDAVRIDHFIGMVHYYAVPGGSADAVNGHWETGPGASLLREFDAFDIRIIAEDLGNLTDQVIKLKDRFGYPGMKILQFAFDSGPANPYLPHHYTPNNVVYGGTHDNETMVGYFSANGKPLAFAAQYLHCEATPAAVAAACLRAGLASVADLAIFTLADHMGLDNRARINTPASGVGNWQWRLSPGMLTDELAIRIREQTKLYER